MLALLSRELPLSLSPSSSLALSLFLAHSLSWTHTSAHTPPSTQWSLLVKHIRMMEPVKIGGAEGYFRHAVIVIKSLMPNIVSNQFESDVFI